MKRRRSRQRKLGESPSYTRRTRTAFQKLRKNVRGAVYSTRSLSLGGAVKSGLNQAVEGLLDYFQQTTWLQRAFLLFAVFELSEKNSYLRNLLQAVYDNVMPPPPPPPTVLRRISAGFGSAVSIFASALLLAGLGVGLWAIFPALIRFLTESLEDVPVKKDTDLFAPVPEIYQEPTQEEAKVYRAQFERVTQATADATQELQTAVRNNGVTSKNIRQNRLVYQSKFVKVISQLTVILKDLPISLVVNDFLSQVVRNFARVPDPLQQFPSDRKSMYEAMSKKLTDTVTENNNLDLVNWTITQKTDQAQDVWLELVAGVIHPFRMPTIQLNPTTLQTTPVQILPSIVQTGKAILYRRLGQSVQQVARALSSPETFLQRVEQLAVKDRERGVPTFQHVVSQGLRLYDAKVSQIRTLACFGALGQPRDLNNDQVGIDACKTAWYSLVLNRILVVAVLLSNSDKTYWTKMMLETWYAYNIYTMNAVYTLSYGIRRRP